MLTEKAAKKWGTKKLPRYSGMGQVAEDGFTNNQWMTGQLIIIGDEYFSFAWIPIEQQIFFGRPSPELALKMLRESGVEPLRVQSRVSISRRWHATAVGRRRRRQAEIVRDEVPRGDARLRGPVRDESGRILHLA